MSSPGAQPDGYFPADAVNSDESGGIADYATATQEDYTAQLNAAALTPIAPLSNACSLLNGSPFAAGVVNMGADGDPENTNGVGGNLVTGTQSLMDMICSIATGSPTAGTTPETIVTGMNNTQVAAANSNMVNGLVDMGGSTAVPGSGVVGAGINGMQMLADFLCGPTYGLTARHLEIMQAMAIRAGEGTGVGPQDIMDRTQGLVDMAHGAITGQGTTGNSVAGTIDAAQAIAGPGQTAVSMYANLLGFRLPFNPVPSHLLAQVPVSHIGSDTPNLLIDGGFDTEQSVVDDTGKWVWDGTAGHLTVGSVKTVADSTLHELLSNLIPVTKDQTVSVSCWASWDGLAGVGYPIRLDIECYKGDLLVDTVTADMQDTADATSEWIQMAGEYDIPADDSVDTICVRIAVTEDASAGTVWFDDIEVSKTKSVIHDAASGGNTTIASFPILMDNLYNGMTGLQGEGADHAQVYAAVESQTGIIVANSAALAQIRGILSPGVMAADDFERDPDPGIGANWAVGYTISGVTGVGEGHWSQDGHNAAWTPVGNNTCYGLGRWTGPNQHSATDYQAIEVVLATAPQNGFLSPPSANEVCGRMSDDGLWLIRFHIDAAGWCAIERVANGVETILAQRSRAPVPQAGSTIALRCGAPGAPRYFQGLVSGVPVIDVTESGATSGFGAGYRGWGMGAFAGLNGGVQILPGFVNQWVAADQ